MRNRSAGLKSIMPIWKKAAKPETDRTWTEQEFAQIYEQHSPMVRSVAYKICGEGFSDDLVQDIFAQIWKKQFQYHGKSSLQTWIYRMAVNTSIDFYRKTKAGINRDRNWQSEFAADSGAKEKNAELRLSEAQSSNEMQKLIAMALGKLNADQRAIIALFYYEEKPVNEIAKILEISTGTVKSRLHYAREILMKELQKKGVQL